MVVTKAKIPGYWCREYGKEYHFVTNESGELSWSPATFEMRFRGSGPTETVLRDAVLTVVCDNNIMRHFRNCPKVVFT